MAAFEFPTTPGGAVEELWKAVLRLLPQLAGRVSVIRQVSVGTDETPVAHGLGFVPTGVIPLLLANVTVWQPRDPDSRFAYFTASSATTINVAVLR